MLQAAVRQATTLRLPVDRLLAVGSVASFLWLLLSDRIHPVVVLLLELYLTF
jgi:hypothetical protein